MDRPGLLSLPTEVLCLIFDSIISLSDLYSVTLTCRRFLEVIRKSNNFWKLKLKVSDTLQRMSSVCYPVGEVPLEIMDKLVIGPIPEMVDDILREKIFHKELNENLTIKFYARKMLQHVRARSLEKKLSEWMSSDFQPFLEGAILISQYGQMMEEEDLTNLKSKVEKNLEHIINQVNAELIIDKSDVNHKEKEILACIRQVMFVKMGFQKQILENDSSLHNFYIDKVLERRTGNLLMLAIIYKEVAKRLGIAAIEFVFSNTDDGRLLHLRWSENEDEFICLTLAGGDLNSPGNPANVYVVVPVQQVFRWICNKLIECSQKQDREHDRKIDRKLGSDYAMRFLYVLRSRNLIHFRRLACAIFPSAGTALKYAKTVRTCHPLCGINVEEAIHFLQSIEAFVRSNPHRSSFLDDCLRGQIKAGNFVKNQDVNRRSPSTKFAVGLVVIYTSMFTGGKVVGVIDSRLDSCFHHVLLEGGDSDLLPEYDLELHPQGMVVNHPLIGLHFERFNGRRYIPNAELKALFPDDDAYASSLVG
ncbi:F-box only protein 21-like [Daphnia pulicaria]|uniref:F-box only protein 21-like n=1 Tax=Daphnia pulicaria TaxID=35523 RepID=UPI001EE9CDAA|nr:F-box only protein 21-like [Daphnia pulicaria]